ncbi:MAG: hypothetical protein WD845_12020 [Pirellulales bacterium]
MEDSQPLAATDARYCCPGESRPIDRATHLNRLATFYSGCRQCDQRVDIQQLSTGQARQWSEILRRGAPRPRFAGEGMEADSINDLECAVVARLATSLSAHLWRQSGRCAAAPAVLVGADGHWSTAEIAAAACAALERAGCRTIDAGAVATAPLAACAHRMATDAALWIGNASGQPHTVAVRFWGRSGRPWSSPGALEPLRELYESGVARPARRGGTLERVEAEAPYRTALAPLFHALRPLRFVVDTLCRPLVQSLERLVADAACEVLRLEASATQTDGAALAAPDATYVERRLAIIRRQVAARQAHFGLWIDGAGESCRLVDQRGAAVDGARLGRLLAGYVDRQRPMTAGALEGGSADLADRAPSRTCGQDVGGATREAMAAAIESAGAVFASGPGDRFWFVDGVPAPDALMAISLLLVIQSESDRPLSEVLDAA